MKKPGYPDALKPEVDIRSVVRLDWPRVWLKAVDYIRGLRRQRMLSGGPVHLARSSLPGGGGNRLRTETLVRHAAGTAWSTSVWPSGGNREA